MLKIEKTVKILEKIPSNMYVTSKDFEQKLKTPRRYVRLLLQDLEMYGLLESKLMLFRPSGQATRIFWKTPRFKFFSNQLRIKWKKKKISRKH